MKPVADIEALWARLAHGQSAQATASLAALRAVLREHADNPHAQWLCEGVGPMADASSASALCEALVQHCLNQPDAAAPSARARHHAGLQRAAQWLRWVYQLVRALRAAARAAVVEPPAPTLLLAAVHPPESPFAGQALQRLQRAERWRAALLEALRRPASVSSAPRWLAAMLLSATLLGGLLQRRALQVLRACLCANAALPRTGLGVPYLDIEHPARGAQRARLQRWLFDPVSAWLLEHRPGGDIVAPSSLPAQWRRLLGSAHAPRDLDDLIEGASVLWLRWGTALDVQLMRGHYPTHDIEPRLWQQLSASLGADEQPRAAARLIAPADDEEDEATAEEAQPWAADAALLYPWLDGLCTIAAADGPWPTEESAWQQRLQAAGTALPDTQAVLLRWLAALAVRRAQQSPSVQRRIAHQVHTLLPAWVAVLGQLGSAEAADAGAEPDGGDEPPLPDPTQWSHEELDSAEQLLLASASARRQRTLRLAWAGLRRSIERTVAGRSRARERVPDGVDARPLPAGVLMRALQTLQRQALLQRDPQSPPALWEMAWLSAVLAFRTGMRRAEILGLRLLDISPEPDLTIVVRPTAQRRLKTAHAQRIIPAGALLLPAERQRLLAWVHQRWAQIGADPSAAFVPARAQAPLFELDLGRTRASAERTAERIIEALADALAGAHIHHLRHAFATWTYLALRAVELPRIIDVFAGDPDTQALLSRGAELHRALLGGPSGSARQAAFAVARLLGHTSPLVSLEHYIHAQAIVTWALAVRECERLAQLGDRDRVAQRALRACAVTSAPAATEAAGSVAAAPASIGSAAAAVPAHWPLPGAYAVLGQLQATQGDAVACVDRVRAHLPALELSEPQAHALLQRAAELTHCLRRDDDPAFRWPTGVRRAWVRVGPHGPYLALPSLRAPAWLQQWQRRWPRNADIRALALPALRIHLLRTTPRRRDVAFWGAEQASALQTYVRLLVGLGLHDDGLRVVLRRADGSTDLPPWVHGAVPEPALRQVLQRLPRVGLAVKDAGRAGAFARWLGLEWSAGRNARPDTLSTALLLLGLLSAGEAPLAWS